MVWRNRPGVDIEQRFDELEKSLGIQNIVDIEIDSDNAYLYVYTETKKFRISMVEV